MLALSISLILASRSPRRRLLLERLGLSPVVAPSDLDEVWPKESSPAEAVEKLALDKAIEVARGYPDALTLGADTVVVLGGEVLGKPADRDEAHRMLSRLSGRTHTVYTGVALVQPSSARRVAFHEATDVTFTTLSESDIARYVAGGSPLDKAGAYGIQDDHGALFVARIDGDFYNVIGLPLHRLYRMLGTHFDDLLVS